MNNLDEINGILSNKSSSYYPRSSDVKSENEIVLFSATDEFKNHVLRREKLWYRGSEKIIRSSKRSKSSKSKKSNKSVSFGRNTESLKRSPSPTRCRASPIAKQFNYRVNNASENGYNTRGINIDTKIFTMPSQSEPSHSISSRSRSPLRKSLPDIRSRSQSKKRTKLKDKLKNEMNSLKKKKKLRKNKS